VRLFEHLSILCGAKCPTSDSRLTWPRRCPSTQHVGLGHSIYGSCCPLGLPVTFLLFRSDSLSFLSANGKNTALQSILLQRCHVSCCVGPRVPMHVTLLVLWRFVEVRGICAQGFGCGRPWSIAALETAIVPCLVFSLRTRQRAAETMGRKTSCGSISCLALRAEKRKLRWSDLILKNIRRPAGMCKWKPLSSQFLQVHEFLLHSFLPFHQANPFAYLHDQNVQCFFLCQYL
jgi:hypothetical protein